ncbi:sulfatase [Lacibacter sp.]|uniref:sulfatase family protein n=1 Tax=Lacibacter sp. TaxID=1915409 RepID=UPI002B4B4A7F|nr:sulfatase [Lacibacter sp.]HLP37704.1 sulfatase [Lacibacter sp.]
MHKHIQKYTTVLIVILTLPFLLFGQQQKPNIVWITIEDTSPDFIGCYGNTQVKTPNIDALAAEGIRFTNAFSTNVVCSPSRHTIITGVRTVEDGCGNHRSSFKIPGYVRGFTSYLKNAGYFTTNNQKTDYNIADSKSFIANNWSLQGGKADFTRRENKSQPFFSVFNFNESHQSRTVGNTKDWYEKNILNQLAPDEIIQSDGLEVPPFYKNNDNNRRNIARLYNALQVTDKKVGSIIQLIKNAGEWENTIVFFFSDHGQGMPRFKTNSSRLGAQVPMVVRIPEKFKHLFNLKAGSSFDELVTFEDLAPTMISIAANQKKPDYMKGRVFMGDKKEITDNVFWCSRDNTDEVIDMARTVIKGDYVYTRIYYPHLPVLQQQAYYNRSDMLVEMRADFKEHTLDSLQASIFMPRSAEYLFNRKTDRWETVNLVNDKRYTSVLHEMRNLLKEKQVKYADLGFVPETVLAQINRDQILLTWKQKNYDVNKYRNVADMVGRGKLYLRQQMKLLNDKDSLLRYWAVVGLRNQKTNDLDIVMLQKAFASEKSDFVKVEMAELLYHHFKNEQYLHWLAGIIATSDNAYIVRQAAMKLANNDNLPEAVVQKIKEVREAVIAKHKGDVNYPIRAALGTVVKLKMEDDAG